MVFWCGGAVYRVHVGVALADLPRAMGSSAVEWQGEQPN